MPFSSVLGSSSVIKPGVCTSSTRPSVPYDGQLIYETDTDKVASYNGSAWVYTATSGLVFITGAAFTTATTVSLPNNTFTATYDNYKVLLSVTAVTADADFTLRMRASGTDDSSSNYRNMFMGITDGGTASNSTSSGVTSFTVGESDVLARYTLELEVLNPFISALTTVVANYSFLNKAAANNIARAGSGIITTSTSYDSLTFISSIASSITGTYRVYGYANS